MFNLKNMAWSLRLPLKVVALDLLTINSNNHGKKNHKKYKKVTHIETFV